MNDRPGRALRILGIVFMALNAALNLLGGSGTVCAAFLTANFDSMAALLGYQWLYQILVFVTIAVGLLCIWSIVALSRSREHSHWNAIILLVVGTVAAGIHYYASLQLRGKAVPANMKLYSSVITLLLFLVLWLPGLRQKVDYSREGDRGNNAAAGGLAAIVAGATMLTTDLWVGASHWSGSANWVDILRTPLLVVGAVLLAVGLGLLSQLVFAEFESGDDLSVEAVNLLGLVGSGQ